MSDLILKLSKVNLYFLQSFESGKKFWALVAVALNSILIFPLFALAELPYISVSVQDVARFVRTWIRISLQFIVLGTKASDFIMVYVFICFLSQALFGILLLVYIPELDPYPDYHILNNESLDNVEYDALPGGVNICPERYASIFSGT